jgi:hypothetical protein
MALLEEYHPFFASANGGKSASRVWRPECGHCANGEATRVRRDVLPDACRSHQRFAVGHAVLCDCPVPVRQPPQAGVQSSARTGRQPTVRPAPVLEQDELSGAHVCPGSASRGLLRPQGTAKHAEYAKGGGGSRSATILSIAVCSGDSSAHATTMCRPPHRSCTTAPGFTSIARGLSSHRCQLLVSLPNVQYLDPDLQMDRPLISSCNDVVDRGVLWNV